MKFGHYYVGKKLYVPLATWEAVIADPEGEDFSDLITAATDAIEKNGSFTVLRESDKAIMIQCDGMFDLNRTLRDLNLT